MVATSSCLLPDVKYSERYQSEYYISPINHADGCCRDGDGLWGDETRQPCKWFSTNVPASWKLEIERESQNLSLSAALNAASGA